MRNKKITITDPFEKYFRKLSKEIRTLTYQKLELFVKNPIHPSLRIKKIKGTDNIWEMSIIMNYRLTFENSESEIFLRKIRTHDVIKNP